MKSQTFDSHFQVCGFPPLFSYESYSFLLQKLMEILII